MVEKRGGGGWALKRVSSRDEQVPEPTAFFSLRLTLQRMSRQVERIQVEGIVKEVLPHDLFKVEMEDGSSVLAHVSGELRLHLVRVLPGHRVVLAMSPYDLRRGRIVSLARSSSTGP